jgi:hypothetical protein
MRRRLASAIKKKRNIVPVDFQATASAPRRPFAMWLMVGGSFLISFTGLIIRNMEAASAACQFLSCCFTVCGYSDLYAGTVWAQDACSYLAGWALGSFCWVLSGSRGSVPVAGVNQYNGCGNFVYLQCCSFYTRPPELT